MAGFSGGCRPLSAVAPIEDDYFLQGDSHGSKPLLMPSVNKWVTQGECLANVGEYISSAIAFSTLSYLSYLLESGRTATDA